LERLRLGVFASGKGSNFQAIYHAIQDGNLYAEIVLLLTNNPEAGALDFAKAHQIPAAVVNSQDFAGRDAFVEAMLTALKNRAVGWIALAGYMKKVPPEIIQAYPDRIFNIHPALLPSFGGKGMYGHFVHEAVLKQGCKVSGVTVHLVDEVYDRGPIVAQRCVPVREGDSPESLAARVLRTEHQLYWQALQLAAEGRLQVRDGVIRILPARDRSSGS
jgi:formyltetrahydrofolate-dependent phosphoribosylglycinamide formyltransferase